jgi:hypothetical protein
MFCQCSRAMQVLQAAEVTTKMIGLFQYAKVRDCGRCKVSHASTARTAPGTSHLASDAAINTFGLLSKRNDPQLSVTWKWGRWNTLHTVNILGKKYSKKKKLFQKQRPFHKLFSLFWNLFPSYIPIVFLVMSLNVSPSCTTNRAVGFFPFAINCKTTNPLNLWYDLRTDNRYITGLLHAIKQT